MGYNLIYCECGFANGAHTKSCEHGPATRGELAVISARVDKIESARSAIVSEQKDFHWSIKWLKALVSSCTLLGVPYVQMETKTANHIVSELEKNIEAKERYEVEMRKLKQRNADLNQGIVETKNAKLLTHKESIRSALVCAEEKWKSLGNIRSLDDLLIEEILNTNINTEQEI